MRRILIFLSLALAFSAIYLLAFPSATLFYEGIVILHIFLGLGFLVLLLPGLMKLLGGRSLAEKLGWSILIASGVIGAALIFTGARRSQWLLLYSHELIAGAGVRGTAVGLDRQARLVAGRGLARSRSPGWLPRADGHDWGGSMVGAHCAVAACLYDP